MELQPPSSNHPSEAARPVIVLNKDLFFGVTIANSLRALGYAPTAARSTHALETALRSIPDAALVIVDIAAVDDWELLRATIANSSDIPAIAFGSHTDVDGMREAKRSGVRRVFSNGEFHRSMGDVITRYARSSN